MRITGIIVCFLLFCATCFGQRTDKYKIDFISRCGTVATCYDCTDTTARFPKKLKNYMSKQINWRIMERITGVIVVDIAINERGNACCQAIYNYTANDNNTIMALDLSRLISGMPAWIPAIKNRQSVSSIRTVAIYSFVKGHPIFDVDYIRSDKPITWEPSKDMTEIRKTLGTGEVDNWTKALEKK